MSETILSEKKSISVCVITYNHEKYIAQTLEGILRQQCTHAIRIFIGEDASTDRTREICQQYANNYSSITLLPATANVGISANFVRTLQACDGTYTAICEGDDYWCNDLKLQQQVDFLEAHPEFSLCFHDVQIIQQGKVVSRDLVHVPSETSTAYDLALSNYILTASVVYRRAGIFLNEIDAHYPIVYDYVLFMECAVKGKLKYMDQKMAAYRIHNSNNWATADKAKKLYVWLDILIKIMERHADYREQLLTNMRNSTAHSLSAFLEKGEDLQRLNDFFITNGLPHVLIDVLRTNSLGLRSSLSYRIGRKLVGFISYFVPWRKKQP